MIQRYAVGDPKDMWKSKAGDYVLYADHLEELNHALKDAARRIAELTAEVARLRSALAESNQFANDCIDQLVREQEESAPLYESLIPLWEVYEKWESVSKFTLSQAEDFIHKSWDALKGFWDAWHIK
jgi:fructose-bisphosphate aldolase class 1